MSIFLLIDGENLKGKMKGVFKGANRSKPVWNEYNFKGLFDKVLAGTNISKRIFYFARVKEHANSIKKSRELIEEQRLLKTHLERQGFEVVLSGRVRGQMETMPNGQSILVFKEKGVDVKIAVDMVSLACDKKVTEIILATSDSDLQPAIKEVSDRNIKCTYLGFQAQPNKGMTFTTAKTVLIRDSEIFEFETVQPKLVI